MLRRRECRGGHRSAVLALEDEGREPSSMALGQDGLARLGVVFAGKLAYFQLCSRVSTVAFSSHLFNAEAMNFEWLLLIRLSIQ